MAQVELKRLEDTDIELFKEAFGWDVEYPRWFQESSRVYGWKEFDEFYRHSLSSLSIGIFGVEFIGLICLTTISPGLLEAHLFAKRGVEIEKLAYACSQLRQLFQYDTYEIFVSVASINKPVLKICEMAGLEWDGSSVLKGTTHGKVIEWLRLRFSRQMYEQELKAA